MTQRTTARAPATLGNLGAGFDLLGLCLDIPPCDLVTITRAPRPGVRVTAIVDARTDQPVALPTDPAQNTATAGLLALCKDRQLEWGMDVRIQKGIPLGSGMGGSAASAAAAIVAASGLLEAPLSDDELFDYALIGEAVASGAAHGDNLAPCLFGGLQLVGHAGRTRVPVPQGVHCVVVHPHMRLDTRTAREVLAQPYPLAQVVDQMGHLAGLLCAAYTGDARAFARAAQDVLVEPRRAALVPGFEQVKAAAMRAGASSCSLSGAGPSVFALCLSLAQAHAVRDAMVDAFATHAARRADGYVCSMDAAGAALVE